MAGTARRPVQRAATETTGFSRPFEQGELTAALSGEEQEIGKKAAAADVRSPLTRRGSSRSPIAETIAGANNKGLDIR